MTTINTKHCNKCKETKPTTDFHNSKRDGLQSECKLCLNARGCSYYKTTEGKAALQKSVRKFYDTMTITERAARKAVNNSRTRSDLSSSDLYGGLSFTEACAMTLPFVEERLRLEQETGVAHHIDHIIPIASGGTHTKENLQVLTAQENIAKGATE